jgi:EAL and modified HD-GYP domain-containing signal transduction protein
MPQSLINQKPIVNHPDSVLLARQPIFNRKMAVFGYQLKYQHSTQSSTSSNAFSSQYTSPADADQAAARVIVNAFTSAGEFSLCDELPTFFRVSSQLLYSGNLISLPPTIIVFDVIDALEPDEQALRTLKLYRKHKFRLAIEVDPNTINNDNGKVHPLLKVADFIRLDINALGIETFRRLTSQLTANNPNAKIIASMVQTQLQLSHCQSEQSELYQGQFLSRPAIVKGRGLSYSQNASLQLVGELQSPDITPQRIAELLSQAPQLSYRLLRLINSATYELTRTIESLQEAVIYLGLSVICHWVSLMVLADASGKPKALVLSTLIRAKMSESLCQKLYPKDSSRAFLIGLMSTLDAMLDIALEQAVSQLPLSEQINKALLDKTGPLGEICAAVIAYEQGDFSTAKEAIKIEDYQLFVAYGEAVLWANGVCEQLFTK